MSKSILQIIYSYSVQKTAQKTTKYWTNESILKIGHHEKAIDLFSLYVLFSHFRPRDATRGNSFFQMSSYARANVRITNEKKQKENSHEGITWSEMGKQNVQAEKVYSPCKILTFAQKLKFQKTCQNPF